MIKPCEVISDVVQAALAPRGRMTVPEWADTYRHVAIGERRGQWSTAATPYLRLPMLAWTDPRVRQITIMSATQIGKTEAIYNCIFYTIDQDPADTLFVYPTKEVARFNNRRRFIPTLRMTPQVRARVSRSKRDMGVGEIAFDRMVMRWVGSNSPSDLESYPYPRVLVDELDRCDPDTLGQVRERMKTYPESKLLVTSSPSNVGVGIDAEYNGAMLTLDEDGPEVRTGAADRRRYVVPCPHCLRYHQRTFAQLRWEGGKAASAASVKRGAWMVCPACSARIEAKDNMWQLERGVWAKATGASASAVMMPQPLASRDAEPDRSVEGDLGEHVGFAISGLCSSLEPNPYGSVAAKWLKNGGVMTRGFVTRTLGEAWAPKGEAADVRAIRERASTETYTMGQVPAGVLSLSMGVDVQQDRMFAEVLGWGEGGRTCWLIEAIEMARVRGANLVELDAVVRRSWQSQDGRALKLAAMGVDSGRYTDEVYRWVIKHRDLGTAVKVWAVKGEHGTRSPLPWRVSQVQARSDRAASSVGEGLDLLLVNTGYWKEHVLARLNRKPVETHAMDDATSGAMDDWRFPRDVSNGYLSQLTAEQLVRERRGTQVVASWVLRPGRTANHYLDCRVYGCAVADREGVRRLQAGRVQQAPAGAPPSPARDVGQPQRRETLMDRARWR